jgi:hypothetical protein
VKLLSREEGKSCVCYEGTFILLRTESAWAVCLLGPMKEKESSLPTWFSFDSHFPLTPTPQQGWPEPHMYTVCIRYSWQGCHQIYDHIRCKCTVLT